VPPLRPPAAYLFEPDPAVLRAGLVRDLGEQLSAAQLDPDIAYLTAGTRMVWVVYPKTQTVTVYRSLKDVQVLRADEIISGEDVLPGFEHEVSKIFE